MKLLTKPPVHLPVPTWSRAVLLSLVMTGVGAAVCYTVMGRGGDGPPAPGTAAPTPSEPSETSTVRIPQSRWAAAGIRVEPAAYSTFTERVWRSRHLSLNETRVAHISPMVDGVVREVKVRLGQDVKEGEILAILDCREVGVAKLDLVKARLAAEYARTQHAWPQTTSQAALELVKAMTDGMPVPEIEKKFQDRPIGDLRQQLTGAYSRRLQTKAQYDAVTLPDVQGAVSQANVIRLRADFEAAEATFRALCEEVKFRSGQEVRASEQKLREAQTTEALAKATLMMLGYTREEVEAMDPLAEGAGVSHYPVRAPFGGTVIEQHAVYAERVGPQFQMFKITDLSSLWLQADVPQTDVPLVQKLAGQILRFRVIGGDSRPHEAEVFYTGDVVDPNTRAVGLTALVKNPDRSLKPGMFVEVELARSSAATVQVPAAAIQRQGHDTFVFIHAGDDQFRRVDVKVGRSSHGIVEVVEGLKPGELVAVSGGFVLKSELFKDQMVGE
jgi:cobalt-zinc-cadmium efflux system membrane fusion protein